MEQFTTFKDAELDILIRSVYFHICDSARSSAMMFVSTRENNNPFHFEQVLEKSNKAIIELLQLYSKHDKRREDFKLLKKELLISHAEDFFATEIY